MKAYCKNCKCEQIFDTSFDEDCNRCSECGCLPYLRVIEKEKQILRVRTK